jgi:hypothetical protein
MADEPAKASTFIGHGARWHEVLIRCHPHNERLTVRPVRETVSVNPAHAVMTCRPFSGCGHGLMKCVLYVPGIPLIRIVQLGADSVFQMVSGDSYLYPMCMSSLPVIRSIRPPLASDAFAACVSVQLKLVKLIMCPAFSLKMLLSTVFNSTNLIAHEQHHV